MKWRVNWLSRWNANTHKGGHQIAKVSIMIGFLIRYLIEVEKVRRRWRFPASRLIVDVDADDRPKLEETAVFCFLVALFRLSNAIVYV